MLSLDNSNAGEVDHQTSIKKVAAALTICSGLALAGVLVNASSNKADSQVALISIPEDFVGKFHLEHDDGSYAVNGEFHKFEHADGDWQIDGTFVAKGQSLSKEYYHSYTLKDDIMVLERINTTNDEPILAKCVNGAGFLTYGQGKNILNNAIVVESAELKADLSSKIDAKCPLGSEIAYATQNGQPWVLCGDYSPKNFQIQMIGEYSTASATSANGLVVDVAHPDYFNTENCTTGDPLIHFNDYIMKGPAYDARVLKAEKSNRWPFKVEGRQLPIDDLDPNGNAASGGNGTTGACNNNWAKKCIIIHGVGNAGMNEWDLHTSQRRPEIRDVLIDPASYAGTESRPDQLEYGIPHNVKPKGHGSAYGNYNFHFQVLSGCKYAYFFDTDTQKRKFYEWDILAEYKEAILAMQYSQCENRLFISTHSMAGMVMQRALIRAIVPRTKWRWFQIQNPWYGSTAANDGVLLCNIFLYGATFLRLLGVPKKVANVIMWLLAYFVDPLGNEICIKGKRMKSYGLPYTFPGNGKKIYPLRAHEAIRFYDPWVPNQLLNDDNGASRIANKRLCGNYPTGMDTQYEVSSMYEKMALRLEKTTRDTSTLTGADWYGKIDKWGLHSACDGCQVIYDVWTNDVIDVYNWNDGAVDATNCMTAFKYHRDNAHLNALEGHMLLKASNHDTGTCQPGWSSVMELNTCGVWNDFFTWGGENHLAPAGALGGVLTPNVGIINTGITGAVQGTASGVKDDKKDTKWANEAM
jgi:hypothetical protein